MKAQAKVKEVKVKESEKVKIIPSHEERYNRVGYNLTAQLEGFEKYDSKYESYPSIINKSLDLLNHEGCHIHDNVLLRAGSKIDVLSKITILFEGKIGTGKLTVDTIYTPDKHFEYYGVNAEGVTIERKPILTSEGKNYWSLAKCDTARFLTRDVINKVYKLVSSTTFQASEDVSKLLTAQLKVKKSLTGNIDKITSQMVDIEDSNSEAYVNFDLMLDDYMSKLTLVESEVIRLTAKMNKSEVQASEDKQAKMNALLESKRAKLVKSE